MPKKTTPAALFDEVLAGLHATVAALQAERVAQLDAVLDDPEGASDRVERIDTDLAALRTRIRTLEDAREHRQAAEQAARRDERIEAARARRGNVIANAAARAADGGLAAQIDAAFTQVLDLVTQYVELGHQIDADLRDTLTAMYPGSDTVRLHDTLALAGGAARGHGMEAAFAIHSFVGEIVKRLGGTEVQGLIQLNQFTRRSRSTLQQAARYDLETLQDRLHLPPPAKPVDQGVTLPEYGSTVVKPAGKLSQAEWQTALTPPAEPEFVPPRPGQGIQRDDLGPAHQSNWAKAIGSVA